MIINTSFGVQASYGGKQIKGDFFLFPYMDDNLKTIFYFAFDTILQKQAFTQLLKISGVGPKTAFGIANMEPKVLQNAVETFDVKALQKIPGVGPKTAKRLLVELKSTLTKTDVAKIMIDEKLLRSIVSGLKSYGYDASAIKKQLAECPIVLEKENLQEIIKWLLQTL
ncbi:MAG: Holliday junction branch migration protein RuvA [bacterium]